MEENKEKEESLCKDCLIQNLKEDIERRKLDFSLLKNVNKDLKGRFLKKCEENRQLTDELGKVNESLKLVETDRDEKKDYWKSACDCIKQMIEKKCFGTEFYHKDRQECNKCKIWNECRYKVEKMSEGQTTKESGVEIDGEL
jgi:hypothetical protein